ncbi:MAG: hypothetical protein ACKVW3_16075 [Phycisphaerales bacterium]
MLWRSSTRDDLPDKAAQFRRLHEAWLTRALASRRSPPSIPIRRVDERGEGGFDALRQRPTGRAHANLWWTIALARVE